MADAESISSLTTSDPKASANAFLWAVDITYDPESLQDYPKGYTGVFKVHPSAILHDLWVPLGNRFMTPVQIWELLQPDEDEEDANGEFHDEL